MKESKLLLTTKINELMEKCCNEKRISEEDIQTFCDHLKSLSGKTKDVNKKAAVYLIFACIEYVIFTCKESEECNFDKVIDMIELGVVDTNDAKCFPPLAIMLNNYVKENPNSNIAYIMNIVHLADYKAMMLYALTILGRMAVKEQIGIKNDIFQTGNDLLTKFTKEDLVRLHSEKEESPEQKNVYIQALIEYLKSYVAKCTIKKLNTIFGNGYAYSSYYYDDCIQECIVAILQHADEFNPKNVSPETFFSAFINEALKNYLVSMKAIKTEGNSLYAQTIDDILKEYENKLPKIKTTESSDIE